MFQLIRQIDLRRLYLNRSHLSFLNEFLKFYRLIWLFDHHALLDLSLIDWPTLVNLVFYLSDTPLYFTLTADHRVVFGGHFDKQVSGF